MEELLEILTDCCPDIDFAAETALIDDRILDSLSIVTIVGELNDHYSIEISVDDLLPENFNSAEAILQLVNRMSEE